MVLSSDVQNILVPSTYSNCRVTHYVIGYVESHGQGFDRSQFLHERAYMVSVCVCVCVYVCVCIAKNDAHVKHRTQSTGANFHLVDASISFYLLPQSLPPVPTRVQAPHTTALQL